MRDFRPGDDRSGSKPGLPPWGSHVRFRRVQIAPGAPKNVSLGVGYKPPMLELIVIAQEIELYLPDLFSFLHLEEARFYPIDQCRYLLIVLSMKFNPLALGVDCCNQFVAAHLVPEDRDVRE